MTDIATHEFYAGFAWAVPRVFADPLSACRFELGDTLYSRPEAYDEPWENIGGSLKAIQVLEPSKGIGAPGASSEESPLSEAWNQEVLFELHNLKDGQVQEIRTTQGRLYTLLWKGNESVLDPKTVAPPVPLNAGAFKKHLEVAAAKMKPSQTVRFLMATDAAAGSQREKLQKVIAGTSENKPELIPANDLDLDAEFLPTVMLAVFDFPASTAEAVTEALKAVLYKPSAGRSSAEDRFRLASHGLLVEPKEP